MKIGVFGVGAMGSLLGAKLGPAGGLVMKGRWADQIDTVRRAGLRLISPDGSVSVHRVPITADLDEVGPVDIALIVEKSYQSAATGALAAAVLKPDGLALTLQNGLGNLETLQSILGAERTTLGVTSEGATMIRAGLVRHAGRGMTHFGRGEQLGAPQVAWLERLRVRFEEAEFQTQTVGNTVGLQWGKLAVNAAINPMTALLRVPNGFLLDYPELRAIMSAAATEVAEVAAALGITLPYPDAAERAFEVAAATAGNHSSMLQDVMRGAPTEIEAICGGVVSEAEIAGVDVPMNRCLHSLIRGLELGTLPKLERGDVSSLVQLVDIFEAR